MKRLTIAALAASTILSIMMPTAANAQAAGTPAFRVPIGADATSTSVDPAYAWLETVGNCSTTCGTGTRTTSYQCQNVADYDYASAGYGVAEPSSMCTSSVGPQPANTTASCTVYSGCGYDWVKPPVVQTPKPLGSNPVGRVGCGFVNQKFSPYCQRTGGASTVVLANSDHRFCSADLPDYNEVASGNADALGYDRDVTQTGSCNTSDHEWRSGSWGAWSSTCDTNASSTRTVTCYRKFDNSVQSDGACSAASRPASSRTAAQYGSCSYSYSYGNWSAWSSGCDTNATRTRSATCMRSNNGGQAVAESECTSRSVSKQAISETSAQYGSCTYAFQTAAWSGWSSGCDTNATRSRDVWCQRSNGDRVADSECTNRSQTKPATSETGAQYGSCSYSWNTGSWGGWNSGCSNGATRTRAVTCTRSNNGGQAVADSECTNRGVARPASSETAGQYGSCSYSAGGTPSAWSGWSSGCSTSATRSRTHQCVRSNDGGQVVGNAECTNRGVNLTESQTAAQYGSCTHNWAAGGWSAWNSGCSNNATSTRSVWCRRDLDGATVSDGLCNAGTRPASSQTSGQYGSCGYSSGGTPSAWSGWSSGCSTNATRSRTYQCIRSNDGGQVVGNAECTNRGVNLTETQTAAQYGSCSHNWATGGWSGWNSGCSSNATSTRAVWCRRDLDGATVSDGLCNAGTRPASSQSSEQYGSCSYYGGPWWGDWTWNSTCSASAQRTQHRTCMRSDGTPMPSGQYCTDRGVPVSETVTEANYSGCSYRLEDAGVGACQSNNQAPHYWRCIRNQTGEQVDSAAYCGRSNPTYDACQFYTYNWYAGDYGGWNSSCSHSAVRTRPVYCRRNQDGAAVGNEYCAGGAPQSAEYRADYSGCGYTANYSGWSSCGPSYQQSRSMVSCTRSLDGAQVPTSECTNRGSSWTQAQSCTPVRRWVQGVDGIRGDRQYDDASYNRANNRCVSEGGWGEVYEQYCQYISDNYIQEYWCSFEYACYY